MAEEPVEALQDQGDLAAKESAVADMGPPLMQLVDSKNGSLAKPRKSSGKRLAWIARRVQMMMGAYRYDDFANADIFAMTAASILDKFPNAVVEEATAPAHGIQTRIEKPPSPKQIRDHCEDMWQTLCNIEMGKHRKSTEVRRQNIPLPPVDRSKRETIEEMCARNPDAAYWLNRGKRETRETGGLRSLAEIVADMPTLVPVSPALKLQLEQRAHSDAEVESAPRYPNS